MVCKNIVLLHGWGASVKKLKPLANELEKQGWKVFVPKLPGFDLKPPESVWGVSEYADYVSKKAVEYFGGDPSTSPANQDSLRMTQISDGCCRVSWSRIKSSTFSKSSDSENER